MSEWLSLAGLLVGGGMDARPVALRDGRVIDRACFLRDAGAWRAAFAGRAGSRFALFFDDAYEFACALFGAWDAGKEVYLPGDSQPATLERLIPQMDGCAGDLPGALQRGEVGSLSGAPLSLSATRLVVYTSGSGGEPLAIAKHLGQLDAEVVTLQATFGAQLDLREPTPVYSTVSHQHIYGLLFCTLWPLAAGRPFVCERLLYPEQMAQRLGPAPSVLVSSPAHLKRLPDTLPWAAARAGLQRVFSSGGPLPPESAQACLAYTGQSPCEVFGSSETGGIAWRQRAVHADRWQLLPGVQWRVEDGLLAVCSPHLPDGQWWLTSDRIQALDEGGFVLLGRADRVVKIEEKRVSLTAMEAALLALPHIAEARLVVLPAEGSSRLALVAVPTELGRAELERTGKRAFNEYLRTVLAGHVERIALPRRFRYVEALPANTQGKSTEAMLLALFRSDMPEATWRQRGPQEARAELDIVTDLAVFDGHFEQLPVLPGVAQLDWAIELARGCFGIPPRFLRAEALKFHRPVVPPARLELALRWDAAAGRLSFSFESAAGPHSSGRVFFASAS